MAIAINRECLWISPGFCPPIVEYLLNLYYLKSVSALFLLGTKVQVVRESFVNHQTNQVVIKFNLPSLRGKISLLQPRKSLSIKIYAESILNKTSRFKVDKS